MLHRTLFVHSCRQVKLQHVIAGFRASVSVLHMSAIVLNEAM